MTMAASPPLTIFWCFYWTCHQTSGHTALYLVLHAVFLPRVYVTRDPSLAGYGTRSTPFEGATTLNTAWLGTCTMGDEKKGESQDQIGEYFLTVTGRGDSPRCLFNKKRGNGAHIKKASSPECLGPSHARPIGEFLLTGKVLPEHIMGGAGRGSDK